MHECHAESLAGDAQRLAAIGRAVVEVEPVGGAVAAGSWGCEAAAPTSRYVASIATDAIGAVTITLQNVGDATIDAQTLTLTPYVDAALGTKMAGVPADAGKQVAGWKCQAGTIAAKFLPGSCRT